jgi:hypothetical protein
MDLSPTKVVRPKQPTELPVDSIPAEQPDAVLLEGEAVSPDGRYHLWLMKGEDSSQAENLIVWDSEENLTKWWDDMGSVDAPSARWSPDGTYLAINRTARTWECVTIIETDTWTDWDVRLPDGGGIPEYTFLPEDWGAWTEDNVLRLMVGQGGDAGEQIAYRCTVKMEEGTLTGTTVYAAETLAEGYDLNDNGIPESITLEGNAGEESSFWVLRVIEEGEEIWADSAATSHAGWNSIFVCHINDDDYLLRYRPTMYQGFASYTYELFFLSETGEEQVVMRNEVEFDENHGSLLHESFDVDTIADFLWELRGYLTDSTLLLSTEDGVFQSGITFDQLVYYPFGASYENLMAVEDREALEERLERYAEDLKREQGMN